MSRRTFAPCDDVQRHGQQRLYTSQQSGWGLNYDFGEKEILVASRREERGGLRGRIALYANCARTGTADRGELAVITVRVPPLRSRLEDLPHLIRAFLASMNAASSDHLFPPEVIEEFAKHEWARNVRELRNYVERSIVLQTARLSVVSVAASPTDAAGQAGVDVRVPFKVAKDSLLDGFERAYVGAVLDACGGNVTKAARMAGIDRMYLHRLVQKLGSRNPLASSAESDPSSAQQRKPVE